VLHDRYRQRLFAYVRQMMTGGSRQDAEDVLQDVFVRAYGALRADSREVNVRAWLYRVAHNRCIDHLRRPVPPAAEIFEVSRKPLHDPIEEAQRREDLTRLVQDIARLPEQQRSALLMREIDGLSYQDLADALDVSVPAIKSLLVRARMGLVDAAEARDADCGSIRAELIDAHDRGVKAPARARRHMRTCVACAEYRTSLRQVRRSFAALTPVGMGPFALAAKVLGFGGAGGGAAAGGSAAGGALAGGGAIAGVTACKVAAVVCTAALAGGAVEVKHATRPHRDATASHATAAHRVHATHGAAASAPVSPAPRHVVLPAAPSAAPAAARIAPAAVPVAAPEPATDAGPTDEVLPPSDVSAPQDPAATPTPAPSAEGDATATDGSTTGPTAGPAPTPGSTTTTSSGSTTSSSGSTATTASTTGSTPASQPASSGSSAPSGSTASGTATTSSSPTAR
jgi:RNA polymerase sigma factor (sigma-70 family)